MGFTPSIVEELYSLSLSLSLSRKPVVYIVFALLIFGTFLSTFVFTPSVKKAHAAGTTYYVRTDGTAIKASAIGPSSDTTKCMSQTTFTSSTFSPLDVIYFSGLGAADYTNLTIHASSSGTLGNLITYQGLTDGRGVGGYPIIATSGISINTNSNSFTTVSGFDVEYAGASASDIHAYVPGTVSYVTLSNLTLNGHGYGYGIDVAGSVSNITLSGITISNIGAYYGVWFPGATNSAISINNLTTSGGRGMLLKNINGLTMTNVISNATFSPSYSSLDIQGGSGVLTINGYSSTGSLARGLYMNSGSYSAISIANATSDSTAYAAGIQLNGVSASSSIEISYPTVTNGASGIALTNLTSPSIQLLNGAIYNNGAGIIIDAVPGIIISGFNPLNIANGGIHDNNLTGGSGSGITVLATVGNSDNMVIENNWIYNNGYPYATAPYNANHDGIDMHANCGNEIIRNNIIVHNGNAGLALVLTSYGSVYNNVIANNGSNNGTPSTSTARGGFYNSGTGSWTLNNNIMMNNYPYEYQINSSVLPPVTLSNNNIFFHNRDSNPLFFNGAIGYTLATWQSTFSQDVNSQNTNPLFVNASGNYSQATDFHLQSNSPAIDAGVDLNINTDYAGKQRYDDPDVANTGSVGAFSKNYVDIGAYEYVTPPDPVLQSTACPSQSNWCNHQTPDISVSPTSTTTSYNYIIDQTLAPAKAAVEAGTASASGSITVPALASDGIWYVHMIGKNLDGDYSNNYSTYTIKYDGTAPTVSMCPSPLNPDGSNDWYVTDPSITLLATDLVSGINAILFHWDTGSVSAYSGAFNAPAGAHTLYYYAVDNAGNVSATGSREIKVLPQTGKSD